MYLLVVQGCVRDDEPLLQQLNVLYYIVAFLLLTIQLILQTRLGYPIQKRENLDQSNTYK